MNDEFDFIALGHDAFWEKKMHQNGSPLGTMVISLSSFWNKLSSAGNRRVVGIGHVLQKGFQVVGIHDKDKSNWKYTEIIKVVNPACMKRLSVSMPKVVRELSRTRGTSGSQGHLISGEFFNDR
jgi:hypothetical protein